MDTLVEHINTNYACANWNQFYPVVNQQQIIMNTLFGRIVTYYAYTNNSSTQFLINNK